MKTCPACGESYVKVNESGDEVCPCSSSIIQDKWKYSSTEMEEIEEERKRMELKRKTILGGERSNSEIWLAKNKMEVLSRVDKTKFTAAILIDEILAVDLYCAEIELDGPLLENANRIRRLIQAALPKPREKGDICRCQIEFYSRSERDCENGYCFDDITSCFLILSNMHKGDMELLKAVFISNLNFYALQSDLPPEPQGVRPEDAL